MPLDQREFDRLAAAYLVNIDNPQEDTWDELDEVLSGDLETSWKFAMRVLEDAPADSLSMIGVSILGNLLWRHPKRVVDRFETAIRSNERFFQAFQYASMTGVPLDVQRRLNAALIEKGADPKFVVEYDEDVDDG